MEIVLYKFNKKSNSTALPYSTVKRKTIKVNVFGDISIITPSFVLEGATGSSPFTNYIGYTYCHVPEWNRYYFIGNMSLINGQWVINCTVDVLATYRNEITRGTAYIQRANTNDTTVPDTIHTTGQITHRAVDGATGVFGTMSTIFIVGVRGVSNTYSLGNTTYYVMTKSQLGVLSNFLWSGLVAETTGVNKGDYLVSCRPCKAILSGLPVGALEDVKIGNVSSGIQATPLDTSSNSCFSETTLLGIRVPKHPNYTSGLDYKWLNNKPYSSYVGNFSIFGTMPLPESLMTSLETLNYRVRTYPTTGEATLFIYDGTGTVIIRKTVLAFPEIQLNSRTGSLGSTIGEIGCSLLDSATETAQKYLNSKTVNVSGFEKVGNSGFGQFMKNTFSMDIGKIGNDIEQIRGALGNGALSQIGNVAKAELQQNGANVGGFTIGGLPNVASSGGGCGIPSTGDLPSITGFFNNIRDVDPSIEGRAVEKSDTIGNYTGMVSLSNPQITPIGATENEKSMIYQLCNGVIYLE